ncbi:MAG: beta-galactosidase [Armatimonadota bacterium]
MKFSGMLLLSSIITMLFISAGYSAVLDDFEAGASIQKWGFYEGPEFPGAKGSVGLKSGAAKAGKSGLAFNFDFTGGGNYVQVGRDIPKGMTATGIRLWVRKPSVNSIGVRVTDSEGQTFQKTFNLPLKSWQEIQITFTGWTGYWGGKGDGAFRGSPTNFALLVQNDGVKKGEIHMDDIRLTESGASEGVKEITYTAVKFGPEQIWYLSSDGKSGISSYDVNTLKFDFSEGAKEIGAANDIAMMGSPVSLKLKVYSRTAGNTLKMRIGSHFQNFERTVGKLDGSGEQVFDVPLGDMSTWSCSGGENNGSVIWPLRLLFAGVIPSDGVKTGEVKLIDVQVRTRLTKGTSVILMPSGKMENGTAKFSCSVLNLLPEKADGTVTWSIKDFSGALLEKMSVPLSIEKGKTGNCETAFKAGSRPFVECEFQYKTGGYTYGPITASAVSELADKGSSTLEPESPFGMGVYLYRYQNDPIGAKMMTKAAEMAMAAGVKWSREEFMWSAIQPERGKFDWSRYDKVVDTAYSHGISVYGLIDYWSEWTKPYTQEGIKDYTDYCRALVTRYKDRIKYWEIWNEPNIFFWPGPKEVYPELLKAAYKTIKEVDPNAHVLGCSTAGIDHDFIKMVMDAGAPFDILTIHPYRAHLDDERFIQELKDVHALTSQVDGKPKPVWITEMGWSTDIPYGVTERRQASLLARTYLCTAASQAASNVSWYDFREDGPNPFYNEHNFGVINSNDFSPKPGYRALASVCRTLSKQTFRSKLNLGLDILAFKFAGPGKETVALWSRNRNAVLRLKVKGTSIIMRNLMGEDNRVNTSGGNMTVITQSDIPIFITGTKVDVSQALKPIFIAADGAAHAGEKIGIRLQSESSVAGMKLSLDAPNGWVATRSGASALNVRIPVSEQPGDKHLTVKLHEGKKTYHIPMQVNIVPSVIEF